MPRGVGRFRRALPAVLEDAENELTSRVRAAIGIQYQAFVDLCDRIRAADAELREVAAHDPICRRLMCLRGIGPMTALALYASVGGARQFTNARQFPAWFGLVPKHTGTGGKVTLETNKGSVTNENDLDLSPNPKFIYSDLAIETALTVRLVCRLAPIARFVVAEIGGP
jgi:transposase